MKRGVVGRVSMPKTACKKSRVSVPLIASKQQHFLRAEICIINFTYIPYTSIPGKKEKKRKKKFSSDI
jgi:hypothetical protein